MQEAAAALASSGNTVAMGPTAVSVTRLVTPAAPDTNPACSDRNPLEKYMLSPADPEDHKQVLGERIFVVILCWYTGLTQKITGMLLAIDYTELLYLLEHHECLKEKVRI